LSLVTPRKGYKKEKLKNLCKFSSGEFLPNTQQQKGNIPVFGGNGINGFHNKSITKNPTIIIGRVGAYCGSIHISKEQCWITDNAIFINSLNEEINIDFLFRYLLKININRLAETAAQPKISQSILRNIVILYPDVKEQQKIATILSNVDNLIESTEKVITHSTKVKKGLMQKLLTRGIGHTKFKKVPWLFGKEIEIPEEWEVNEIQNHVEVTTGSKNTQDKVQNGKYPFYVRSQKIERIDSFSFDEESVLTAGDGVGTGKVFHYVNEKFDLHQRAYKISNFSKNLNGFYFFYYFKRNFFARAMSMNANASVDSIRMDTITKMQILIPPLSEQQKISSILSNIDSKITSQEQYKEKLEKLKKSLMQKLLTGEVRV
jgi:type I restriction enzyme, S subunit